jgi:FOG: EAL domain
MEKSAIEKVNKIKELDIKIAIDDLGTGYSSLSYIENLPVDIIKIDISFIKRMLNRAKSSCNCSNNNRPCEKIEY